VQNTLQQVGEAHRILATHMTFSNGQTSTSMMVLEVICHALSGGSR